MEVRIELPQLNTETWEVGRGKNTTQKVERVFKSAEERADFELECAKQHSQNWIYVRRTEAERPWNGIPTLVVADDELHEVPVLSSGVAKTAS